MTPLAERLLAKSEAKKARQEAAADNMTRLYGYDLRAMREGVRKPTSVHEIKTTNTRIHPSVANLTSWHGDMGHVQTAVRKQLKLI